MPQSLEHGRRLIPALIDEVARGDPLRSWASIPQDNADLKKGYQDINYKQFANAINHAAWWLQEHLPRIDASNDFETLAYAGHKDLRYPIIAVAVAKLGKKLLLCSPFATTAAQNHLLTETQCTTYLHAASLGPLIHKVLESSSAKVSPLQVPELDEWLCDKDARVYPYDKTWEQAESDPWLIFHTSGTTGLPKPIVYTNWMMSTFDAAELMPHAYTETINDQFRNNRFYVPLPTLHFVGMTAALQWTVYLNMTLVLGPVTPGPATPEQVIDIMEHGRIQGIVSPPSLIQGVCHDARGLEYTRRLTYVYFAGAPLPGSLADKLVGHCKVQPAMGSTEAGGYFIEIRNEDDWDYYCFPEAMGVVMEPRTQTLYELVFLRKPGLERWQQLFKVYPNLDKYETSDLWTRHPQRKELWRYAGRTDDLVIFSHGEDLYATEIESILLTHPEVKTALVGGDGRVRPFLIIEFLPQSPLSGQGSDREAKLDAIWSCIEKANEHCSDYVKFRRDLVLFTDPAKPLPTTDKATVARKPAIALYQPEIDLMYSREGASSQ